MDSNQLNPHTADLESRAKTRPVRHVDLLDLDRAVRDHGAAFVVTIVAHDHSVIEPGLQQACHIRPELLADDDVGLFPIEYVCEGRDDRSARVEVGCQESHGRNGTAGYDPSMDVQIFDGPESLAMGAADFIAAAIDDAPGALDIGLAGGSTPQATYSELATRRIEWDTATLWLSDERWVPQDSDDSNGHQAQRSLVDALPDARLLRPRYTEHLEPADAAAYYEAELRSAILERPALVLLGMGTDGHVASLFPGTDGLADTSDRWFIANHVPQLETWRLTVTPHLLEIAERIAVIVSGEAKADVLAEAVERPAGRYPIEILHRSKGTVTVLCDQPAASSLTG